MEMNLNMVKIKPLKNIKLNEEEIKFIISLYPRGRKEDSVLTQLQELFPTTHKDMLRTKMMYWIRKVHEYNLVGLKKDDEIRTVALTLNGVKFAKAEIMKMFKKDLDAFVTIMNHLMEMKDSWAIKLFSNTAKNMVHRHIRLYAIIFTPQTLPSIVRIMKTSFQTDLTRNPYQKDFERVIHQMNALGLIEIQNYEKDMILSATPLAQNLFLELMEVSKKRIGKSGNTSVFDKIKEDLLILSVLMSVFSVFGMVLVSGFYEYLWMGFIPFLVLIFYYSFSRMRDESKRRT